MTDDPAIDPDSPPLSDAELAGFRPRPLARRIRQTLGLSQEAFAARYGIPLSALQAWEEGRSEPDAVVISYLTVIAADPEGVARTLAAQRSG